MQEELVALLTALGLSRNEAFAYVTLLEEPSPEGCTGYEVAARSGVPRSAVYTVLARLEDLGAAFCQGEKPARYVPTDPEQFIAHLQRTADTQFSRAREALARVPKRPRPEPIWTLSRYDAVIRRIQEMLSGAERSVYVSLWAREVEAIGDVLVECAASPDLHCVLHSPDVSVELDGFACWFDDVTDDDQKRAWSHRAIVIVDHREALIGGAEPDADNQAVWTRNPSLVNVAVNHIVLDVTRLAASTGRSPYETVAPMMRPHLLETL